MGQVNRGIVPKAHEQPSKEMWFLRSPGTRDAEEFVNAKENI